MRRSVTNSRLRGILNLQREIANNNLTCHVSPAPVSVSIAVLQYNILFCYSSKCSTSLHIRISTSWLLLISLDEQQINHVVQTGCCVVISIHTDLREVKSLRILDGWLLVSWWRCNIRSGYADVMLITVTVSLSFMRCYSFMFDRLDGFVLINNLVLCGMASVTDLYNRLQG